MGTARSPPHAHLAACAPRHSVAAFTPLLPPYEPIPDTLVGQGGLIQAEQADSRQHQHQDDRAEPRTQNPEPLESRLRPEAERTPEAVPAGAEIVTLERYAALRERYAALRERYGSVTDYGCPRRRWTRRNPVFRTVCGTLEFNEIALLRTRPASRWQQGGLRDALAIRQLRTRTTRRRD